MSHKRCLFRDTSETSQKHLSQVFAIFQKCPTKMISCDFRRVLTIFNRIDVVPSKHSRNETYKQVCHEYQWTFSKVLCEVGHWS